ncbi:unnamed protein product [Camellia sinensis]
MWLATKKSVGLAKHSLTVTGSALSAYSSAQHVRSCHEVSENDREAISTAYLARHPMHFG